MLRKQLLCQVFRNRPQDDAVSDGIWDRPGADFEQNGIPVPGSRIGSDAQGSLPLSQRFRTQGRRSPAIAPSSGHSTTRREFGSKTAVIAESRE